MKSDKFINPSNQHHNQETEHFHPTPQSPASPLEDLPLHLCFLLLVLSYTFDHFSTHCETKLKVIQTK